MTGLNWLQEHRLPQENEDKQEKNTEGQQQDCYCVASSPRGCQESEAHRWARSLKGGLAWPHLQDTTSPTPFAGIGMTWLTPACS